MHLLLPPAAASILNLGAEQIVQAGGTDLVVTTQRASPVVLDLTGDGLVHLYPGVPEPTTLGLLGLATLVLRFRRAA